LVETYPPADVPAGPFTPWVADSPAEAAAAAPAPAAGLAGSVTSMYAAPLERESPSTALAEIHFARRSAGAPK
jgi:hypothetical protein